MEFNFFIYFEKTLIKNRIKIFPHCQFHEWCSYFYIKESNTSLGLVHALPTWLTEVLQTLIQGTWVKLLPYADHVLFILIYIILLDLIFRDKGFKG